MAFLLFSVAGLACELELFSHTTLSDLWPTSHPVCWFDNVHGCPAICRRVIYFHFHILDFSCLCCEHSFILAISNIYNLSLSPSLYSLFLTLKSIRTMYSTIEHALELSSRYWRFVVYMVRNLESQKNIEDIDVSVNLPIWDLPN